MFNLLIITLVSYFTSALLINIQAQSKTLFKRRVNLSKTMTAPFSQIARSGDVDIGGPIVNNDKTKLFVDNPFVTPNKRKVATQISSPNPKRYVLDQNTLCKQNKFNMLNDHSYASTSNQVFDSEMLSDEQPKPKEAKIPPIFLHNVNNHQGIVKDIKDHVTNDFSTAVKGTSLKINLTDITDFRKLTAFYHESQVRFHTFQTTHDKKLEVVLRNVPYSLSEEEIKLELLQKNLPVLKVVRLLNKDKNVLPLCCIELENSESGHEVFKVDTLCHAVISVEPKRKSREIPQCTRCQRYNHTKNFCNLDPRCVRCTGQHHYSQCPLAKSVPPKCVNCDENHTANFKGCSFYQDLKAKLVKSKKPQTRRMQADEGIFTGNDVVWPELPIKPSVNVSKTSTGDHTDRPLNSYADILLSNGPKHLRKVPSSSTPTTHVDSKADSNNVENPLSKTIEAIILDFVKSMMPQIKIFLINAITSIFNNGSAS